MNSKWDKSKMSFDMFQALRCVSFAVAMFLFTPTIEYPCQTIEALEEIVCIDENKRIKARYSKHSDTEEEKARKKYIEDNRDK